MTKYFCLALTLVIASAATASTPNEAGLLPLLERVNIQTEIAANNKIIDGEWVAVGTKAKHAIQRDSNILLNGVPSYRFDLKENDNTLTDYNESASKGRAELSYCYAVQSDYASLPPKAYEDAQKIKTVYHKGKGICPQGGSRGYTFSIYVPSSLSNNVSTIFAQWHGMPSRTLVQSPEGEIKQLSDEDFIALWDKMIFKKNVAHHKEVITDKQNNPKKDAEGNIVYKAGKPSGWLVEQGGYPPLAFGFQQNYFYIKSNSDRKWLTDKDDRTNANVTKDEVLVPKVSEYKSSMIAYRMPFDKFPKNTWVTFTVHIDWSVYGGSKENIIKPGKLDVVMSYVEKNSKVEKHIVDNLSLLIGRNDDDGYYFKFGIYRVNNSTVPVCYNLAGYKEW